MHARVLDRHRFGLLMGGDDPTQALAALDGYRNPDGGYGWGLEPDFRSVTSQPGAALHAFEVFEDIGPATSPRAVELCDWLESITLADGGVPFALPFDDTPGSAIWWQDPDSTSSSLQISSIVAATAHRAAQHDPAIAGHPWLARATEYCLTTIATHDGPLDALPLTFSLQFLDAVHDGEPRAAELLDKLGAQIPESGLIPVEGGTEDEFIRPLDIAPYPSRPVRELFSQEAIDADLDRLAGEQRDDGGWTVEYQKFSPAGSLDWRGHVTIRAISILQANGRLG